MWQKIFRFLRNTNVHYSSKSFLKFPHLNRRITASLGKIKKNKLISTLLFIVTFVNIFQSLILGLDEEKKIVNQILRNPYNSSFHLKLGQLYLPLSIKAAQGEYLLAQELWQTNYAPLSNTLGAISSPIQTFTNIINQEQEVRKKISFWQNVLKTYPDYQYANIKIASLYLEIGNQKTSKEILDQILVDNPGNNLALMLKKEIE